MSAAETVATEKGFANRVAVLAVAGGILPLLGTFVSGLVPFFGSLLAGQVGNPPRSSIGVMLYPDQRPARMIIGSLMIGVGLLCVALTVVFLTRAAVARGGKAPRIAVGVTLFGGVAMFVGYTLQGFALVSISSKFAKEGGLSYDEMQNLLKNPMRIVGSWAGLLGTLTLGFGFVMASLNAMRVGLLTRFLGYLGILAGVMIVLPLMGGLLLVQAFWLLAVAATIAGRWPGGRPPAWDDGEAHPWPSAAEVRAQAAEARELADSEKGASKNGKGA